MATRKAISAGIDAPQEPRFVLYARKSSETEDRQIQSIPDQKRLAYETAEKEFLSITHEIEEARSAKAQGKRPGFRQLIELIERGEADGILAWHPDRLARNAVDGGWILDLLDRGKLKKLAFVKYNFENTPEGKFMLGMIFSQSKYFVDKLSVDVRRGLESKREKGHYPHRAPEGYVNDVAEKTIEPDPERLPILRQAIDMILTRKHTPSGVFKILNEEWGYRTRPTKKSKGGPLSRTSFYDLLSNPFYFGLCREKDLVYKGVHRPLMTEEEFDQIQVILGKSDQVRPSRHDLALTGLLRCGSCGCSITATIAKGHVYYHCTNARKVCNRRGVRENILLDQVGAVFDEFTLPKWTEPLLNEIVESTIRNSFGEQTQLSEQRERTADQAEKQLKALLSLRLRDMVSDEEYVEQKATLEKEIKDLRKANVLPPEEEAKRIIEACQRTVEYAIWAKERFGDEEPKGRRAIAEQLGEKRCLTGGNLLLELSPELCVMRDAYREFLTFKLQVIGSRSAKRTASEEAVLHGWASRTMFELWSVLTRQSGSQQSSF